ncbi:MAG: methyltransferase domain-containing protein, partial [Candidatus Woesearchaeota archaeon]
AKIFAIDRSFAALSKASKNAKIAGVERWIEFKKLEIEHLANSLIQESIDLVVSVPLQPSRSLPTEFVQKVYDKLWLQLEQIVTKNGKILFAFNNKKGVELLRTIADKAFYVHLEKPFLIGKESWIAIGFCKP